MGARSLGYSAGSYSRSASWTRTMSPVASRKPRRRAAPFPWFPSWKRTRISFFSSAVPSRRVSARSASSRRRNSRVPSVDPSSTTRISLGMATAWTRWRISGRVRRSLYTGTTTDRRQLPASTAAIIAWASPSGGGLGPAAPPEREEAREGEPAQGAQGDGEPDPDRRLPVAELNEVPARGQGQGAERPVGAQDRDGLLVVPGLPPRMVGVAEHEEDGLVDRDRELDARRGIGADGDRGKRRTRHRGHRTRRPPDGLGDEDLLGGIELLQLLEDPVG